MAANPFETLNTAQRAAATHGEATQRRVDASPLLIIAGAGTGKTSTLAHRVAHLVMSGVDPGRILLLTFSRRAAEEMTRRAERIIGLVTKGSSMRLAWAGTFHSVGNRLLRLHASSVGLDAAFSVLDRGDSADLLDVVRHELGLAGRDRRFPRKDTCLAIYSHRVNTQGSLADTLNTQWPWCAAFADDLQRLFRAYVARKQAEQVLDYDDLLLYWHGLVSEPRLAHAVSERFEHILVDEYQDTNRLQAEILQAIRPDGRGLTVVGDDAQAIYSFRAATVDNILEFPARFTPPAQLITLEENYRSTQPILDAANALLREAPRRHEKQLRAHRAGVAKPRLVTVVDDRAQADYVIDSVLSAREAGVPLKKQAVLFRSGHHSDLLEVELTRRNIPFVKYGGLKFLEAAHVKDLLAVLRWADNPRHRIAAFRALQLLPGMGPGFSARCLEPIVAGRGLPEALAVFQPPASARAHWEPFRDLMERLAHPQTPWAGQVECVVHWYRPHLERIYDAASVRAGDLDQLSRIAGGFLSRERFLTELALDPPRATGDESGPPLLDEDYLVLSTVHSAKGQEWNEVFVLNVNDGNFPSEFAGGSPALMEEERRLLYVAMTRARDALHLLTPLKYYVTQQPKWGDAHVYGARSRFLTPAVLDTLDCITVGTALRQGTAPEPGGDHSGPSVDVAAKVRGFWD
jgi:DNA helicase II / ATP-dependent DNA helicase PcrA